MNNEFVKYTTKKDERFDQIAFAVYGDVGRWKEIIDANPTLPIIGNYEAGLAVRIPILSIGEENIQTSNLPPWKT